MADERGNPEEEGFKFVDKRRIVDTGEDSSVSAEATIDALSETDASSAPESPAEVDETDHLGMDGMPGMDGVFGIASYAIGLLSMSAWQYLGLVSDPQTGKAQRDLKQARIAIDCVGGMVDALDKNSGAVDPKTMGDLKRVLNDLRLNFVTQSNMSAGSA